jgi:hypothetical protein
MVTTRLHVVLDEARLPDQTPFEAAHRRLRVAHGDVDGRHLGALLLAHADRSEQLGGVHLDRGVVGFGFGCGLGLGLGVGRGVKLGLGFGLGLGLVPGLGMGLALGLGLGLGLRLGPLGGAHRRGCDALEGRATAVSRCGDSVPVQG